MNNTITTQPTQLWAPASFHVGPTCWVSDADEEICNSTAYAEAHEALIQHLGLDETNTQMTRTRPQVPWTTTIVTYVDLYVSSIIDVNEKAQSISTQIKLIIVWRDSKFSWNPNDFCGIGTLAFSKNVFWSPDIGIVESIKTEFGTKESPNVQLRYWGFLLTSDVLSLTTACKMDLYRFPFDIQSCSITLQSSSYSKKNLVIDSLNDAEGVTFDSKESFKSQGEWELLNINISTAQATIVWDDMDQLIYQITIKRKPFLYFINIILPVFFFIVLDVTSFFMGTSGSDKLSFKVTLLLSISVLLLILNDILPSTADKIPLIGVYCTGIFCLIGISIVETILVNFLMARGAESRSLVETTAAVSGQDDGVRDLQSPPDSVRDQNEMQRCLCWTRVARIIDVAFFVLYIITIIVFLSVLGKLWVPVMS
ncbi:5-hydroxytryptamine receptor 3A-like [Siphateles boraxobius]|uniref:5-hydroxytryptamine receptor 3A-like n=1 Tax=Siphateles boraxobius TaxID=180520 RepID=UPI004062E47A